MNNEPLNTFDWSWLWGILGAGVTQIANWVINKKKEEKELQKVDAEVQSSEIDNVEKAIAIWRNLANEMNAQVVELKAQIKNLSDEVAKLQVENTTLKAQVEQLIYENNVLQSKIDK